VIVDVVCGSERDTIACMFAFVLASCSGESVRMSPLTIISFATTFVLPSAVPPLWVLSLITSVPPMAKPGLNVRYCWVLSSVLNS
jgi:hypothetical protein